MSDKVIRTEIVDEVPTELPAVRARGGVDVTADTAFDLYVSGGGRSLRQVAQTLGLPFGTVASWSKRYRWVQRVRDMDAERIQGIGQSFVVAAIAQSLRSVHRLTEIAENPEASDQARVNANKVLLDQGARYAHLLSVQLGAEDDDDIDYLAMVQTPEGAYQLLNKHRTDVQR